MALFTWERSAELYLEEISRFAIGVCRLVKSNSNKRPDQPADADPHRAADCKREQPRPWRGVSQGRTARDVSSLARHTIGFFLRAGRRQAVERQWLER